MTRTLGRITLTAAGAALVADDGTAGRERRTITGLAVPYGTPGRTSAGELVVTAGAVTLPDDVARVKLLNGHDREAPVGYAVDAADDPDGLVMTFRVGATPAGDAALADAAEHLRDALSVELDDVLVADDGRTVLGARLTAVALVALPAFPDARVAAVTATEGTPAMPDLPTGTDTVVSTLPAARAEAPPAPAAPAPPEPAPPPGGAPPPPPAPGPPPPPAATATLVPDTRRVTAAARGPRTVADAAQLIAATARGEMRPAELTAALSDFTTAPASGGAAMPPQWIGQLWDQSDIPRPHVDAITGPRPLTSLKVQGFQWTATLQVGAWNGDKAAIPSNAPTAALVEETAGRWAGGVDVAREFIDLGSADLVAELLGQAVGDYRSKTDLGCLADLLAGGSAIAHTGTALTGLRAAVKTLGAARVRPSTIWVAGDLYDQLAGTSPAYAFLSGSLTLDRGGDVGGVTLDYDPDLPAGKIVALTARAATFHETGPIRVEALDIARGGVDEAVHGYTATIINRQAAIAVVTVTAAP